MYVFLRPRVGWSLESRSNHTVRNDRAPTTVDARFDAHQNERNDVRCQLSVAIGVEPLTR